MTNAEEASQPIVLPNGSTISAGVDMTTQKYDVTAAGATYAGEGTHYGPRAPGYLRTVVRLSSEGVPGEGVQIVGQFYDRLLPPEAVTTILGSWAANASTVATDFAPHNEGN